jgi:hypothetical protein
MLIQNGFHHTRCSKSVRGGPETTDELRLAEQLASNRSFHHTRDHLLHDTDILERVTTVHSDRASSQVILDLQKRCNDSSEDWIRACGKAGPQPRGKPQPCGNHELHCATSTDSLMRLLASCTKIRRD